MGILTLSLIFIIGIAYFFYGLQPTGSGGETKEFKVVRGEGVKEIGARLSQFSLIKSISVFKLYSLVSGNAQKFKPGVYELRISMSVPQIIKTLTAGGADNVKVVIPEGLTLKDVDFVLAEAGVIRKDGLIEQRPEDFKDDFPFLVGLDSLEGFLFPDTYQFKLDSSPKEVTMRFLNNFKEKAWPLLKDMANWYERLVLASLLEREVPSFSDRQLVAGILLKRLKTDMPLQVDASITYVKCQGQIKGCVNPLVTRRDLTFVSSYNTYQHLGLTPAPIANPGQAAIKAAVAPIGSSYWYYLSASGTKETIFSKTLEEHNANRIKYL